MGSGPLIGEREHDVFADRGFAVSAHASLSPGAAITPTASLYYARFDGAVDALTLAGATVGIEIRPLRAGVVVPYLRAGAGLGRRSGNHLRTAASLDGDGAFRYGALMGESAVGIGVGRRHRVFATGEVAGVVGVEGTSNTGHYGSRTGAGYRFCRRPVRVWAESVRSHIERGARSNGKRRDRRWPAE